MIIQKIKNHNAALFYINQTIENNWSRAVLEYQIETNLYQRQGKAITNFKTTMPEIDSDLANALLKDSYNFEFLTLSGKVKELELEQKLIDNITHFLLELGKGFAYLGRQFEINVGGEIFKTDLLFYHTKLKCYVVIELKVTKFKPEYVGKLNFYITAIDRLVKDNTDKPTIGILLCKSKNNVVVDFALHDINKPLGVSEYTYKQLPENLKNSLPSVEQIENELNKFDDE
jgi:predicted nuclease of restriction endonuclease-like (RecB) superfamily